MSNCRKNYKKRFISRYNNEKLTKCEPIPYSGLGAIARTRKVIAYLLSYGYPKSLINLNIIRNISLLFELNIFSGLGAENLHMLGKFPENFNSIRPRV